MDNQKIAEARVVSIVAVVVFVIYILGVGPLGVWLIFNPLGIVIDYTGRVSMSVGILMLKSSLTNSGSDE